MPKNNPRVPTCPPHWNLSNPVRITKTFASEIWKVTLPDGSPAIIKSLRDFPDVWDELRGAYFLKWRDGVGAVRLLASEGRVMLLEYGGERLLADVISKEGDNTAAEIAAETLSRMLSPSEQPLPPELQPLRERFAGLFTKTDRAGGHPSIYVEAAEIAEQLLTDQRDVRPLHGDLHHENIIFGPRGWLVIDPKGVLGDPAFDAGNMFFNPLNEQTGLCLDENRIAFMADTFGRTLGQPPARILDFAFAYGCLSAAWHAEDGNKKEEELELSVARTVRAVRLSF